MTEALAVPAQPAAPAAVPGTAPPGPADAAGAFLAALQALATGPPPGVATPSARTAPAEGAKAGGDSSEPDTKADAGDPAAACSAPVQGLVALLGMAAPPIQVTAQPETATAASANSPATPVKAPPGALSTGVPASDQDEAPLSTTGPVPVTVPRPVQRDGGPTGEQPTATSTNPGSHTGSIPVPPTAPGERHPKGQPMPGTTQHHRIDHEVPATTGTQPHGGQTAQGDARDGTPSSGGQTPSQPPVDAVPAAALRTDAETPAQTAVASTQRIEPAAAAPAAPAAEKLVRLRELPEAVRTAVRVAVREGRTEATIELHPRQLGHVEIHLRYEAGGVTASVTAESRAAAAALTAQAPDLKRALESQGLTVLGLDVQQTGVGAETTPDRDRLGTFGQQGFGRASDDDPDDTTTTTVEVTSLPLADGQVDVLA